MSQSTRQAVQAIPSENWPRWIDTGTREGYFDSTEGIHNYEKVPGMPPVAGVGGTPCPVIGHGTFTVKSADGKLAIPVEVRIAPSIKVSLMQPPRSWLTDLVSTSIRFKLPWKT